MPETSAFCSEVLVRVQRLPCPQCVALTSLPSIMPALLAVAAFSNQRIEMVHAPGVMHGMTLLLCSARPGPSQGRAPDAFGDASFLVVWLRGCNKQCGIWWAGNWNWKEKV